MATTLRVKIVFKSDLAAPKTEQIYLNLSQSGPAGGTIIVSYSLNNSVVMVELIFLSVEMGNIHCNNRFSVRVK